MLGRVSGRWILGQAPEGDTRGTLTGRLLTEALPVTAKLGDNVTRQRRAPWPATVMSRTAGVAKDSSVPCQ